MPPRPRLPLASLLVLAAAACALEEPAPDPPLAGACARNVDCGGGSVCQLDSAERGTCVPVFCSASAECPAGEECHLQSGVCLPPLRCLDERACEDGERCLVSSDAAACLAPSVLAEAAGCDVVSETPALRSGALTSVRALAHGERHRPLPFAALTLSTPRGALPASGTLLAECEGEPPCRLTVRAQSPSASFACETSVLVLAPAPADALRVTLVDESSGAPLEGALIAVRTSGLLLEERTDQHGVALFPGLVPESVQAVSALPEGHDWHSVVGPAGADLLLVTRPTLLRSEVAAARGSLDFGGVSSLGDFAMGLGGLSLERGLSGRMSLATVLGGLVSRRVSLEGLTPPGGIPLRMPLGMELHIGQSPVSSGFVASGRPGRRLLWTLGGKVRLQQTWRLLESMTDPQAAPGDSLAEMLHIARRFDHGVGRVLPVIASPRPADESSQAEAWSALEVASELARPDVFPRRALDVAMPLLPCADGGEAPSCRTLPSALVALLAQTPLGQVPLGMTHAEDDPDDEDGVAERDGIIRARDGAGELLPAGVMPLGYAPLHDGLEGQPTLLLSLAFDIDDAMSGSGPISLVQQPAPAGDTPTAARAFLPLPEGEYAQGAAGGRVTLSDPAPGADLHRFHLEAADGAGWHIWLADGATSARLSDLLPAQLPPRHASAALQAIDLGTVGSASAPESAFALFAPDGTSLASLRRYARAFASAGCPLAGGPPAACVTVDE